ncbi:hypothetical protein D3C76_1029940 [compost metagenome]
MIARQLPGFPLLAGGVVAAQMAVVPLADPQSANRIGPQAPRTAARRRRIDGRGRAGRAVDMGDMVAGQRRVPDLAIRRDGDAVWPAAARSRPDLDVVAGGVEPPVEAALPGEPEQSVVIEHSRVQVRTGGIPGQRKDFDAKTFGVHADDGVEAAVGDPGIAVRAADHPVRRGARAERDRFAPAGLRVEAAKGAGALGGVPDLAIGGRRHVVRAAAPGHVEVLHAGGLGGGVQGQAEQGEEREAEERVHGVLPGRAGCAETLARAQGGSELRGRALRSGKQTGPHLRPRSYHHL